MKNFNQFIIDSLNECVIFGKSLSDRFILYKQRDRGIYPDNQIVVSINNDVEIVFIEDMDSGWREGLNEFGVGILNTRFSKAKDHLREPREHFKPLILPKSKIEKIKSEKVDIITEILSKSKTIEEALQIAIDNQLMGSTLISDGNKLIELEMSDDYGHQYKIHNTQDEYQKNVLIVRTNHGILIPDIGYQEYPNSIERHSSEIRKVETERMLQNRNNINDLNIIFNVMSQQVYDKSSEMNVFRTTDKSMTGGQILLDPLNLTFYYKGIQNFKGIKNRELNSKIKIQLIENEII